MTAEKATESSGYRSFVLDLWNAVNGQELSLEDQVWEFTDLGPDDYTRALSVLGGKSKKGKKKVAPKGTIAELEAQIEELLEPPDYDPKDLRELQDRLAELQAAPKPSPKKPSPGKKVTKPKSPAKPKSPVKPKSQKPKSPAKPKPVSPKKPPSVPTKVEISQEKIYKTFEQCLANLQ